MSLKDLCEKLEHFETDPWAAPAVLKAEILTRYVLDPCTGTGILAEAAKDAGYTVAAFDIHDWGYPGTVIQDFHALTEKPYSQNLEFTVFMNPPFSEAEAFIEKAFALGARKVVCFQRFAWYESNDRSEFWDKWPPARIYVCGDRATCWRHDIPKNEKGQRIDPETGKKLSGSPTAHAWFVFEPAHPKGTLTGRVYKAR